MQERRRRGTRWLGGLVGLAVIAAAASAAWHAGSAGADTPPQFSVSPAAQTVPLSGGTAQVDVSVSGVSGMRAFQFLLRYDPGVLKNPTVSQGPFLGTSGVSPYCPSPQIDGAQKGTGSMLFGCATTSGGGASGSGVVATVTFQLAGGAQSAVVLDPSLSYLHVADQFGNELCGSGCGAVDGAITVSDGDASKDSGLAPTPTPPGGQVADTPVPTQTRTSQTDGTPGASAPTPGPGTPAVSAGGGTAAPGGGNLSGPVSAVSGRPTDDVAGAGGVTGVAGAASRPGASGSTVGKLGTGTAQRHRGDTTLVLALAIAGMALLPPALLLRRRRES